MAVLLRRHRTPRPWRAAAMGLVVASALGGCGALQTGADRDPAPPATATPTLPEAAPIGQPTQPGVEPPREASPRFDVPIAALRLRRTDVVADLQAGDGDRARRLAAVVRSVLAVEGDPASAALLQRSRPANMEVLLAAPQDANLPRAGVDVILLAGGLARIADRTALYSKLRRALRRGGRIVIVDTHARGSAGGSSPAERLGEAEVARELHAAGFLLARKFDVPPNRYLLEFR